MTDRPVVVAPGQRWGLWTHEAAIYQRLTVERVDGRTAFGVTESGSWCACSVGRLLHRGDYLGEVPSAR